MTQRGEGQQGKHHTLHQSSPRQSHAGREKSSKPTPSPAAGTLDAKTHTAQTSESSGLPHYSSSPLMSQDPEPCPFPSTLPGPASRNVHPRQSRQGPRHPQVPKATETTSSPGNPGGKVAAGRKALKESCRCLSWYSSPRTQGRHKCHPLTSDAAFPTLPRIWGNNYTPPAHRKVRPHPPGEAEPNPVTVTMTKASKG